MPWLVSLQAASHTFKSSASASRHHRVCFEACTAHAKRISCGVLHQEAQHHTATAQTTQRQSQICCKYGRCNLGCWKHPSGLPPLAGWLILPAAKAFPELRSLQRVAHVARVAQRCATAAHEPGRLPPVQLSLPLQLIERVAHCSTNTSTRNGGCIGATLSRGIRVTHEGYSVHAAIMKAQDRTSHN